MNWFKILFGWAFVAAGTYEFIRCVGTIWQGHASLNWPPAGGTVQLVEVKSRQDGSEGGGIEYAPRIIYSYTVDGEEHENTEGVPTLNEEWGDRDWAHGVTRGYRVDDGVVVYYEPENPARSVLERGVHPTNYGLAAACLLLIALGLWMAEVWAWLQGLGGD